MVVMSVDPTMRGCWTGLAELGCLRGILMDSHLPKRVSMLPAILIHKARSQTYRFADGVQSFFGTGRISHGISVEERYVFLPGQPLGKGSFGEVRVAMDKHTRERNAVKCAFVSKRDKMSQKENQKEKDYVLESFIQESQVHLKLDHPNIVKLLHVYANEGSCHLVMELCSGGELYDRWYDRGVFTEDEAIIALRTYLHWHRVCHRDLKLENWVYKDHSDLSLKLIDFGFAKAFSEEKHSAWRSYARAVIPDTPMTATLGTIYYIAPEVIKGSYNYKCDLWSTGIILYMLLAGEPPFYSQHCDDWTMQKICNEPLDVHSQAWDDISEDCKDFVCQLLDRDVSHRPTAREISQHRWLAEAEGAKSEISKKVLEDLRDFGSMNVIKRAAFGLIAFSMVGTDDLRDSVRQLSMTEAEAKAELRNARINCPEGTRNSLQKAVGGVDALFEKLDLSGDDEIEYSEFIAAANGSRYMCNEALIKQAFERLDVDHSGVISIQDLRQVFGDKFNGNTVEEILAQVDYAQNGVITYDEFVRAMMELQPDEKNNCGPLELRKRISHAYEFTSVGRRNRFRLHEGQKIIPKTAGMVYKASQHFQRARIYRGQPPALRRGWHTPDISR
ncbi:unnamed protein product [Durusdinium trenchii]|uniref:Calcium-dependent protein kinase n=1 Tax=Durusdinium trenchii TaxID=1381693 RepID=A0ABP0J0A6_9DINO